MLGFQERIDGSKTGDSDRTQVMANALEEMTNVVQEMTNVQCPMSNVQEVTPRFVIVNDRIFLTSYSFGMDFQVDC